MLAHCSVERKCDHSYDCLRQNRYHWFAKDVLLTYNYSTSTVMPLEPVTSFPYDFHGYKLLKRLGGGCKYVFNLPAHVTWLRYLLFALTVISEAYLAETPEDTVGVSRLICLKIFTDKSHLEPGRYTVETATEEFMYQRKVLREIQHPFIVCGFPDLLLDVKDCVPTELGLCTLEAL